MRKLSIRILDQVQNKILRPIYKKNIFQYFAPWLQRFGPKFPKVLKRPPQKIFLKKKQICFKKTHNSMLISDLFTKSPKKACEKSYEQNSQLKGHFLAFTHTLFKFF